MHHGVFQPFHGAHADSDVAHRLGARVAHVLGHVEQVFKHEQQEQRVSRRLPPHVEGQRQQQRRQQLQNRSTGDAQEIAEVAEQRVSALVDYQIAGVQQREIAAFLADRVPEEEEEEEHPSDGFRPRQRQPFRLPHPPDVVAKIAEPLEDVAHGGLAKL